MRTYKFTNNGQEYVIQAQTLSEALAIYRERLRNAGQ